MMDNNQINNNNMKKITLLTMLFALFGVMTPPASAQVEKWYTADGKFLVNTLAGLQDFTSLMSASMVRR